MGGGIVAWRHGIKKKMKGVRTWTCMDACTCIYRTYIYCGIDPCRKLRHGGDFQQITGAFWENQVKILKDVLASIFILFFIFISVRGRNLYYCGLFFWRIIIN